MTRRSETCRPTMLGMLDMLSTTFMTRDPGQRIIGHYGLSGDRLETECGSRQTLKPVQGVCGWSGSGSEARAVPRRSRGSREWSIRLATYSSGRWIMKKVFSSSDLTQPLTFRQYGLTRRRYNKRHIGRRYIYRRLPASSKIMLTCFMNGSAAVCSWVRARFRRSSVRCLKIAAASAALHRDPQCVSDDRPSGFQISCEAVTRKNSLHMLAIVMLGSRDSGRVLHSGHDGIQASAMPLSCQHALRSLDLQLAIGLL